MGLARFLEAELDEDFDFEQLSRSVQVGTDLPSKVSTPSISRVQQQPRRSTIHSYKYRVISLSREGRDPTYPGPPSAQRVQDPISVRGQFLLDPGKDTDTRTSQAIVATHRQLRQTGDHDLRKETHYLEHRRPVKIHSANQVRIVKPLEFLSYFWSQAFCGACMVCGENFEDGKSPPIRTISMEPNDLLKASIVPEATLRPLAIRIHNRHLACIKSKGHKFIPFSHVWHQSVDAAHQRNPINTAAAACLYRIVTKVLPVVTAKFEHLYSPVEIWHDYISIPQWSYSIQQSLLLMLPAIFEAAPLCLVHLEDIHSSSVALMARGAGTETLGDQFVNLASFFRASWFQRMWVALEYGYCKRACLYTKDHKILYDDEAPMRDSFTYLLEGFQQRIRYVISKMGGESFALWYSQFPTPIIGLFANVHRNLKLQYSTLTFGEVVGFLADRECRDYRDRFLAMSGLLQLGYYEEVLSEIPKDPVQACYWVAWKCLEKGDYSPFLLLQRGEVEIKSARWLTGHQAMSYTMWDLGSLSQPPDRPTIIQNNRILLDLDLIGSIESSYRVQFSGDGEKIFDQIMSLILSVPGHVCASRFVVALERIYAVPLYLHFPDIPISCSDFINLNPNFKEQLENLLNGYLSAGSSNVTERLRICQDVVELLYLNRRFNGSLNNYTRLTYAGLLSLSARCYDDNVSVIRCGVCQQLFPYRVSLFKATGTVAQLYRIPGLGYASSLPNGVGLLIKDKRIVGRMIYGTPACPCRQREMVEVE
jgi:hypothetical protein